MIRMASVRIDPRSRSAAEARSAGPPDDCGCYYRENGRRDVEQKIHGDAGRFRGWRRTSATMVCCFRWWSIEPAAHARRSVEEFVDDRSAFFSGRIQTVVSDNPNGRFARTRSRRSSSKGLTAFALFSLLSRDHSRRKIPGNLGPPQFGLGISSPLRKGLHKPVVGHLLCGPTAAARSENRIIGGPIRFQPGSGNKQKSRAPNLASPSSVERKSGLFCRLGDFFLKKKKKRKEKEEKKKRKRKEKKKKDVRCSPRPG